MKSEKNKTLSKGEELTNETVHLGETTAETDEFLKFIQRTKLQNRILKKMTQSLIDTGDQHDKE